jgi:hypothetical protein
MIRKIAGLAVAAVVPILAVVSTAHAEEVACGKRSDLLAHFQEAYHEVPNVLGLTTDGRLLEVVVAPTGTWTMLVTVPGGPACVVATGQDWQSLATALGPAA